MDAIRLPFKMNVAEFIGWHEEGSLAEFMKNKQLPANFCVLSGDNSVWMMRLDFSNKDFALKVARVFCQEQSALSCSLATEAWVTLAHVENKEMVKRETERIMREGVVNQANKREVVIIAAEIKGKLPSLKTFPIRRIGPLVMLGDNDAEKYSQVEGRAMNILGTILN